MKLFVSDLDGTLLNRQGRLSAEALPRLCRMLNDGLQFTVASARSIHSIRNLCSGLNIRLPVIALNGAFLSSYEPGPHYDVSGVPHDIVEGIVDEAEALGLGILFSCHTSTGDDIYHRGPLNPAMQWFLDELEHLHDERYHGEVQSETLRTCKIACISVMATEEPVQELTSIVAAKYGVQVEIHCFENMYSPGFHWMTVHSGEARKEIAIAKVARGLGLNMSDVTVFGDQFNDLGMVQHAGFGVAVGNAVPELKQIAKAIIGTNEDNAVIDYLETAFYGA